MGTADTHFSRCRQWWTHSVTEVGLPGHGHGEDIPEGIADEAVNRVRALIERQPRPPIVVGASYLGAAIAFHAARDSRAAGIVMSGYSFLVSSGTLDRWLEGFTRMADRQQRTRDHFADLHGPQWKALLTRTLAEVRDGRLQLPDLEDLKRCEFPVQLVNGALLENERRAIEPAVGAGADVTVLGGAGHLVPMDAPRAFVAAVEGFAERVDAKRTLHHERRRSGSGLAKAPTPRAKEGNRV